MFYALLHAVIRRILSLGGLSSDTEAEVLVLRHELAVLRRQISARVGADETSCSLPR